MAAEAVAVSRWHHIVAFVRDSYHEIRDKTTWPDFPQVRQASIAIVVFVLVIGLFITLLDAILKGLLINLIPSLFR
ncbi:MAG TPA: preprotein translocase subunit SecE [Gemmatimonadaceae bacterium]|jgi:preprotein translocase SecE subunit